TFLIPQVTGAPLPYDLAAPAAFGDLTAATLAFLSVFALRLRWPFALVLVWVFTIEGSADLLFAYYQGRALGWFSYQVGPVWYIPTFIVPLLLVIHVLIFWLLLRPSPAVRKAGGQWQASRNSATTESISSEQRWRRRRAPPCWWSSSPLDTASTEPAATWRNCR